MRSWTFFHDAMLNHPPCYRCSVHLQGWCFMLGCSFNESSLSVMSTLCHLKSRCRVEFLADVRRYNLFTVFFVDASDAFSSWDGIFYYKQSKACVNFMPVMISKLTKTCQKCFSHKTWIYVACFLKWFTVNKILFYSSHLYVQIAHM